MQHAGPGADGVARLRGSLTSSDSSGPTGRPREMGAGLFVVVQWLELSAES